MTKMDRYDALRTEVASMRRQRVESKYGLIPASVCHLEKLVAAATADEDRAVLYSLLIGECSRARNDPLYIECLRNRVRDLSNDPTSHAGHAFALAVVGSQHRVEALDAAYRAVELAKSQVRLVRYCATNLVRVALVLNDYDALQRGLKELVGDATRTRREDTGYEFDFVDQIDIQRCDAKLLAEYKALA